MHFFHFSDKRPHMGDTGMALKMYFSELLKHCSELLNTCLEFQDFLYVSRKRGWPLKLGVEKGPKSFKNIFLPINILLQFIEAKM